MLRTHKLGEADRIITLLTRHHGRVRAVAKGVRRTTSRFGSRLEPFTHVDLQLAEGRNLDTITQAETLSPFSAALGGRLRPLHRRHRDARDRRAAGRRGEGAVAAAVPAARRRAARDGVGRAASPARCSTPTCCGRWPWPGTRRRSSTARAAGSRARTAGSTRRWAACSARPAGSRARPTPAAATIAVLGALLAGDWPPSRPPTRAASRRPAASSRRTSPGTSSVGSARWRTSSADADPSLVHAVRRRRVVCSRNAPRSRVNKRRVGG